MSCQKVINVLAVASFVVSGAVVGSGLYVYVNRGAIVDGIKSQVMDAALGSLGGLGGGLPSSTDVELPTGTNDLAPAPGAPQQASADLPAVDNPSF